MFILLFQYYIFTIFSLYFLCIFYIYIELYVTYIFFAQTLIFCN